MADIISSSSLNFGGVAADSFDDACSICLEPFNTSDPSTVTNCKHEYHLHCILEWSQRSKECPICMQSLVLKDPASQELLAAVERERISRARRISPTTPTILHHFPEDSDIEHDASYSDDSDFDEHFMHRLAAITTRARFVHTRARQRSHGHSPLFVYTSTNVPDIHQHDPTSEGSQNLVYELSDDDSLSPIIRSTPRDPSVGGTFFSNIVNRDGPFRPGVYPSPPDSPQQAKRSDFSFSESIKSKFSAASSRCKESFAKSTRGFKEKLLVQNNSVKELSKGVQRDMNAGFARMLERLDLKRMGSSLSDPGCAVGSSNFSLKGKGLHESAVAESFNQDKGKAIYNLSADAPSVVSCTTPGEFEVSRARSSR